MANGKKKNQGRRVRPTLASGKSNLADSYDEYEGPSSANMRSELEFYGKKREQLVDISTQMESIFSTQQQMRMETDQIFGIEKKMLKQMGFMANQVKMVALQKELIKKHSLEDSNILSQTIDDYQDYNRQAQDVAKTTKELLSFRKAQIPFENKILSINAEIQQLLATGEDNLSKQEKARQASLVTMKKGYLALSMQEQINNKIEKTQENINDLMSLQGTAAGSILKTIKDLVTNPLTIMVSILAIGVSRFETMRQRGNDLASEMDSVNKKLAGAGPFQDKILRKAELIRDRFYDMGEGFSSSLEGSVDAIVALSDEFNSIDYISGELVKTMGELKLSIGLGDEAAAKVLYNFTMINGQSNEAAIAMTDLTYQMAEQAGLNPQVVFQEIASASGDTLASFSGSADELAKSAVTARKLGISLNDMASVSSSLLDFETSIEKEMEAQLITGMDLNLQKARMLAMQGDEAGAMEEVMRQVGSLDKFNNMMPYQQRALAEAVGMTVGQLQKTTDQREREAKHAQEKYDLVEKQYALAEKALPMLNKLDAGLGVLERIAVVLGDLFLDVFGTSMKDLEKDLFALINSQAFKTGFTNILYTMKGIVLGIVDAVKAVFNTIDTIAGGRIGRFLDKASAQDFSGGQQGAENLGKTIGKVLVGAYLVQKTLGTLMNPMIVTQHPLSSLGKFGGKILSSIGGLFGKGGSPGGGGLPGQGSLFPSTVPHGKGFSGGAAAGGMGKGAMMGYGVAAGFIAKGAYDVMSLDQTNTSGESAGAVGGLIGAAGGAKLGAVIGTMIAPGIGTAVGAAIGAGIGYFGGKMVKHIAFFQDDLDKARIEQKRLANQEMSYDLKQNRERTRAMLNARREVESAFRDLAYDTDGLTKNELRDFAQAQFDAGNITKNQFNKAVKGTLDPLELLAYASNGAANALGVVDKKRTQYVADQMLVSDKAYNSKTKQDLAQSDLTLLRNLTDSQIEDMINTSYSMFFNSQEEKDKKSIAKEFSQGTGIPMKEVTKALNDLPEILSGMYYSSEGKAETIGEDIRDKLIKMKETQIIESQNRISSEESRLKREAQSKFPRKRVGSQDTVPVTIIDPNTVEFAQGGVLNGPSHSLGGIQTNFGEMEGGEAVINKRSTSMYADLLSSINQAGGGKKFEDGGITGGFTTPPAYREPPTNSPADTSGTPGITANINAQLGHDKYQKGQQPWLDEVNRYGGLKGQLKIGSSSAREFSEIMGKTGEFFGIDYGDSLGKHEAADSQLPGGKLFTSGENGAPGLTYKDAATINMMQAASRVPAGGGLFGGTMGRQAWRERDIPFDDGKGGRAWQGVKPFYNMAYSAGMKTGTQGAWAQTDMGRGHIGGTLEGTRQGKLREMAGISMFDSKGKRNSPEYVQGRMKALAGATGGRELLVGILAALAAPTGIAAGKAALVGGYSASTSAGALSAGLNMGANSWGLVSGLAKAGLGAETIGSIASVLYDVWHGDVGEGGALKYMAKSLPKPISYIPKAFQAKNDLDKDPTDYLSLVTRFLPTELGIDQVMKGGMKSWKAVDKRSWGIANSLMSDEKKEIFNNLGIGGKTTEMGQGGIIPNSPIKKVNDMVLTKDGQMIETHPDDNLIAKKGKITQNSGGSGKSRVEDLLEQLIMVTGQKGDVFIDGAKVSAAVDSANYRA